MLIDENSGDHPFISIIIPIYNEENFIEECLSSLVNQDYPPESSEILVIDGMSTDNTRDVVDRFSQQHPHVRLVDNPKRNTSAALNIGVREASGKIIVRVDGHTIFDPDYCSKSVEHLFKTQADCVGGPMNATGISFWGRTIALATSSRFGIGDAAFHYSAVEGWVDAVYLGTYRREVFDRVGLFEEEWRCDEDDEFNYRLRKAGGRIYFTPQIKSRYYNRSSLSSFCRQYFRYGFWKVRVFQRHPTMMKFRHFIPFFFVLGLVGSGLLGLFFFPFTVLFWLILSSYLTVSLLFSANISRKKGWRYILGLPVVFATLHLSYGTGFLLGLVAFADEWFEDKRRDC